MHHRRSLGDFVPSPHRHRNAYREVEQQLSRQDRIALAVTGAIGTMYAVYVFAIFMAGWICTRSRAARRPSTRIRSRSSCSWATSSSCC